MNIYFASKILRVIDYIRPLVVLQQPLCHVGSISLSQLGTEVETNRKSFKRSIRVIHEYIPYGRPMMETTSHPGVHPNELFSRWTRTWK